MLTVIIEMRTTGDKLCVCVNMFYDTPRAYLICHPHGLTVKDRIVDREEDVFQVNRFH